MHAIDSSGVLVDDLVMYRPNQAALIHPLSDGRQVFADPDIGNRGGDGGIGGARFFTALCRVTLNLGIPRIDLGSATAEPDEDAGFRGPVGCGCGRSPCGRLRRGACGGGDGRQPRPGDLQQMSTCEEVMHVGDFSEAVWDSAWTLCAASDTQKTVHSMIEASGGI